MQDTELYLERILAERNLRYRRSGPQKEFNLHSCPHCHETHGHGDNHWKLYIHPQNGLYYCHRCHSKGNMKALFPEKKKEQRVSKSTYTYCNPQGAPMLRVHRHDKLGQKFFFQENFLQGFWIKGGYLGKLQPYGYETWKDKRCIFIVEGEKCVRVLEKSGFSATTFPGGSHGWKPHYREYFQGKSVVLLPDQDRVGFQFMREVYMGLKDSIQDIRILLLPGLKAGEDVADWLSFKESSCEKLLNICSQTPPRHEEALEDPTEEKISSWPPLKTLEDLEKKTIEDISVKKIPSILAPWLTDICERMQVPLCCVAALSFSIIGSLIERKARIYPKREDDWYEVANLWAMVIMPSGRLKSPMIQAVMKPLQEISEKAHQAYEVKEKEQKTELIILEARENATKKSIHKITQQKSLQQEEKLLAAHEELSQIQQDLLNCQAKEKRYKIHDATVEKIADLLKSNENGLLLIRDELSGWLSSMERQGRQGDREFFLEAWNGKGSYDVDRIARGSTHIPALCLSILGSITPSKIQELVKHTLEGSTGNDGLLQRFSLMIKTDFKDSWELVDRRPDEKAYKKVFQAFKNIDQLDDQELHYRFSPDAQEMFYLWLESLEKRIRKRGDYCDAFISHLSKYRKLVPSLSLQFAMLQGVESPYIVDVESLRMAIHWAAYLEQHAETLYLFARYPEIPAAQALASRVRKGDIQDGMRLREIYRHQWSLLKNKKELSKAISPLMERHWVQVEEIQPPQGAPYEILRLHPDLRA